MIYARATFFSQPRLFVAGAVFIVIAATLSGCASEPRPQLNRDSSSAAGTAMNSQPVKDSSVESKSAGETRTGSASFISERFQGKKTASGEIYDQSQMVAAHPTYPPGTIVRVTNMQNERTVEVRVVDRGATTRSEGDNVIIDLSRAAAEELGFTKDGKVRVRTEVLQAGK